MTIDPTWDYVVRHQNSTEAELDESLEPALPVVGCDCVRPPWLGDVLQSPEGSRPNQCISCGLTTRHPRLCLICIAQDILGYAEGDVDQHG